MKERKSYFNCIRKTGDTITVHLYHSTVSSLSKIIKAYDFIIPLDRKPRNATDIHTA